MRKEFEYFLAVLEEGTITKAAAKLFISQPYLSQYIIGLEKNMGTKLFDRSVIPMRLTAAGEVYFKFVKETLQMQERLKLDIMEANTVAEGSLSIGMTSWRSTIWIPLMYPYLIERFPFVKFSFVVNSYHKLCQAMRDKKIDFCILQNYEENYAHHFREIYTEDILFVTHKDNPLLKNIAYKKAPFVTEISISVFERFLTQSFASMERDSYINQLINRYLEKNGLTFAKKRVEVKHLSTVRNFTFLNQANAFLPSTAIDMEPENTPLVFFKIKDSQLSWAIGLAYIHNRELPLLYRQVMDFCVKLLTEKDNKIKRHGY